MKHNLVFGIVYTVVYFVAAVLPINPEGTGPMIFILAPGVTWLLVLTAVFLSKRLSNLRNRIIFVLLLLVHYGVAAAMVFESWQDQYPRILKMIGRGESWFVYFPVVWYVVGQLVIWASLARHDSVLTNERDLP